MLRRKGLPLPTLCQQAKRRGQAVARGNLQAEQLAL
jgi:hypothetical protein